MGSNTAQALIHIQKIMLVVHRQTMRLTARPTERSSYHEDLCFERILCENAGVTVVSPLEEPSELLMSLDGCYDKTPLKTRQNYFNN